MKGQILQYLSMLFQNLKNEMVLLPLLSNNRVNLIINIDFDFSDPDLVSAFISLLRTLAFKMNPTNVPLFYSYDVCTVPLLISYHLTNAFLFIYIELGRNASNFFISNAVSRCNRQIRQNCSSYHTPHHTANESPKSFHYCKQYFKPISKNSSTPSHSACV